MKKDFSCSDSCSDIVVSVKRGTSKAGGLKIFHDKGSHPHYDIISNIGKKIDLTQTGHPRLLVCKKGKLIIRQEIKSKSDCFIQPDV